MYAGVVITVICVCFWTRFMQDLEDMLGFRPNMIYFYLWKYVSPFCLIVLISATVIEMVIVPPGYNAWVQDLVSQCVLEMKVMYNIMYVMWSKTNVSLCLCRLRSVSRATLLGPSACALLLLPWRCFLCPSSSLPVTST